MHERISKFEILKDKSFSNKGPVMIKNGIADNLSHSDHSKEEKIEVNREISKKPSLKDVDADFNNDSKESQLQQYLKTKISESRQKNWESRSKQEHSNEYNELVAFPSDDEASKKMKEAVIKDMSYERSEKDIEEFYDNEEEKIQLINEKETKDIDKEKEIKESNIMPPNLLSINEK
jgi:protein tyrosine/serine phosphatase